VSYVPLSVPYAVILFYQIHRRTLSNYVKFRGMEILKCTKFRAQQMLLVYHVTALQSITICNLKRVKLLMEVPSLSKTQKKLFYIKMTRSEHEVGVITNAAMTISAAWTTLQISLNVFYLTARSTGPKYTINKAKKTDNSRFSALNSKFRCAA